jgi:hypothetical protein
MGTLVGGSLWFWPIKLGLMAIVDDLAREAKSVCISN